MDQQNSEAVMEKATNITAPFVSIQDMVTAINECINDDGTKNKNEALLSLIKRGWDQNLSYDEMVSTINSLLISYNGYDKLGLYIQLNRSLGKCNRALSDVGNLIKLKIAKEISLSDTQCKTITAEGYQPEKNEILNDLIFEYSSNGVIDGSKAIQLLTLVLRENINNEEFGIVETIISRTKKKRGHKPSAKINAVSSKKKNNRYEKYLRKVIPAYIAPEISFSKISNVVDITQLYRDDISDMNAHISALSREIAHQTEKIKYLTKELEQNNGVIAVLHQKLENAELINIDNQDSLRKINDRLAADEVYWRQVKSDSNKGIFYKVKKTLEHELGEIEHSLTSSTPLVAMALDRVKNIKDSIARMEKEL